MSQALVQAVKQQLEGQGKDLSGPCGAFAITARVAWLLRATAAGLLDKPAGNNCQNYATDIIAYPDGRIRDILGDAGGANTPQWGDDSETVDPSRYRPAFDPGDMAPLPEPSPAPTPTPPPPPADDRVLLALEALTTQVSDLLDVNRQVLAKLNEPPPPSVAPVIAFPAYVGRTIFGTVTLKPQL
jgi:hypothetical protein